MLHLIYEVEISINNLGLKLFNPLHDPFLITYEEQYLQLMNQLLLCVVYSINILLIFNR